MKLSELTSALVIVPSMTAFHTRNKPRGIAVPRTIAVLQIVQCHHGQIKEV